MSPSIERVAVIGAGTMGAAIAAHCANAGLPVLLLDIAPRELTDEEATRGLDLEHPTVKNRIVREGLARIAKLKPASFMSAAARERVEIGNLDDDFERLAEADWIVEAIVEKLDIKRRLLERLDGVRADGAIVTTNTSGLPIHRIAEGRSDDLRRHFFGTHFFNPPRYMKLLEVIPGDEADEEAVAAVSALCERRLGKGVVRCRDTPNFIANRISAVHSSHLISWALSRGYRIEEVDAVTGPLIGRPKTATFRLQDLVGIDVAAYVSHNLHDLIPDDPEREILKDPNLERLIGALVKAGRLGNKSGAGFYRKGRDASGRTIYEVLDPATGEYGVPRKVRFDAVGVVRGETDLGGRLRALFADQHREDRGAALAWRAVGHLLSYAARVAPEVAFDLPSVDRALRWGFAYELGPFELWDELGVARTAERLAADGLPVADWVQEMLAAGRTRFYDEGRCYSWEARSTVDVARDARHLAVDELREAGRELRRNPSASLLDLGEGVLLLELHGKMNAIDDLVVEMMGEAGALLEDDAWRGLVIGNDGANFSVGANLMQVASAAQAGDFDAVRDASRALQEAILAFRYSPKPVVAAVHGMALGGGCELALGAQRIVAHAESYVGLVEVGVGLVPAGGGLKELVRRVVSAGMFGKEADPLPLAQRVLETVGMAKVSTSAAEAAELGFLGADDRIVMNRDHLLYEARREVLAMASRGFTPPRSEPIYAGGRDLLAALRVGVWMLEQSGYASAHDARIGGKVAEIIAGGDASVPGPLAEEAFLALERRAFVELLRTAETQARIAHMLETGKPLRN